MSTHYVLKIQYVNKPPETRNINARVTTIGREAGDIVLGDPQSSGRHAEIYFENGNVRVKDLGSTNGTFFNGQRTPEFTMQPGQGFSIGQTVMTLMAVHGVQARPGAGKTMIAMGGMPPRPPGPPGAPPPGAPPRPPGAPPAAGFGAAPPSSPPPGAPPGAPPAGFGAPPGPPPGGGFGAPPPSAPPPGGGFGAPPPGAPPQGGFGGPPPGAPPQGGFGGPPPGAPPQGGFGGPPPGAPPQGGFGGPPPSSPPVGAPPGGGFGAPPPGGGFGAPPPSSPPGGPPPGGGFGGPPPGGGGFGAPPPSEPPGGSMAPVGGAFAAAGAAMNAAPQPFGGGGPMSSASPGGQIRGDFSGTGSEMFGQLFVGMLLTGITLGIYMPWFQCSLLSFLAQRITFGPTAKGTVRVAFEGKGVDLFGLMLVHGFLTFITGGIYMPWYLCKLYKWFGNNTAFRTDSGEEYRLDFQGRGGDLFVTYLIGFLLTFITAGIYMPWFMCKMAKWIMAHAKITKNGQEVGGLEFTGEGGDLFVTYLVGAILTGITLGIYMPWFQCKMMAWQAEHTKMTIEGRRYGLRFSGEGGELFVIGLVSGLLMFITIGFYYFWFLVKLLKWQLSNLVIQSEGGGAPMMGAPMGGQAFGGAPPAGQMYGQPPQGQLGAPGYGAPQGGYGAPPQGGGYGGGYPPQGGGYA